MLDADLAQHAVSRVVSAVRAHDASPVRDGTSAAAHRAAPMSAARSQEVVAYAA